MKYVDEFRDAQLVRTLIKAITSATSQSWNIMEICGGQTHSIMKYGLLDLLPNNIHLVHGPGCPVCVTPIEFIDRAVHLSQQPNIILASFGDMLRVPGSQSDLLSVKAQGADVRTVLSPLAALELAKQHPDKEIVFFAVGFETTAPAIALSIIQAKKMELNNFSVLVSHVLVPPAMEAILSNPQNKIQGFLAAGHVCTVMGTREYFSIAKKYQIPIVVTGFEPVDILAGILRLLQKLEAKDNVVVNEYKRSVKEDGNLAAQKTLWEVFSPSMQKWRGIGKIPQSGLKLNKPYRKFDAVEKFELQQIMAEESKICIAGEILTGQKRPFDCPAFNKSCTPENPMGAPMVSSEGACAAYIKYFNQ
ncbi:MAG: hydrogenase formation protein HypD [Bacteroidetes bacterium HGW-Bacteroidetes-4]|jgi:hydrogenase expression/formation protein HypD|nr:MAG: hydrogenase formation protein HypD [Bacteroidetes bacterium HGW-Bacteroidetes-4]